MSCFLVFGTFVLRSGGAAGLPLAPGPVRWRTLRSARHILALCGAATKSSDFLAVAHHVALMRLQSTGEDMPTTIVADEVERVARGGIQGGMDGNQPRRAD